MEPLKAGDWVRDTRPGMKRPIVQLQPNCIALTNLEEDGKHYIRWVPDPTEWCWFWTDEMTQAHLDKLDYSNIEDGVNEYIVQNGLLGSYMDKSDATFCFTYCEPFIGNLPSILKE